MKKLVLYTAACAAALALFFAGLGDAARSQSQEGRRQLERALRRASLACYAAEGPIPRTWPIWSSGTGSRSTAAAMPCGMRSTAPT